MTTRREFLSRSMTVAAAAACGGHATRALGMLGAVPRQGPLKILILGGTAFLGPEMVAEAVARGHQVTLFNRGRTRAALFPDLEKLRGDRDPTIGDGLNAIKAELDKGRTWDIVFDNSGYYPRHVKASAELVAPSAKLYVFISSISAYADNSVQNQDESAATAQLADPNVEDMGEGFANYGGLKALCEQAAESAMPGRTAVIRPGFIVGPGDWTYRFNYWPLRVRDGGEVLAPGTADDPIQVIDVRDLAAWCVRVAENGVTGRFNACGPDYRLTMGRVLETCREVTGSSAAFTWVDAEFLAEHGAGVHIWVPPHGETAGFHTWSNARAVAAGLTFRPLADTVRALLEWHDGLDAEQKERFTPRAYAPMSRDREAELLAKWHEKHG